MAVPDVPIRYAIVTNARTRREADAYLPDNYAIVWQGRVEAYKRAEHEVDGFVIAGRDVAGWTLDDYVIPRYASGLIGCHEIDLSHPVMQKVPADPDEVTLAQRDEDGPADDELYNRPGVEGGIAYALSGDEPGSLGENDHRL